MLPCRFRIVLKDGRGLLIRRPGARLQLAPRSMPIVRSPHARTARGRDGPPRPGPGDGGLGSRARRSTGPICAGPCPDMAERLTGRGCCACGGGRNTSSPISTGARRCWCISECRAGSWCPATALGRFVHAHPAPAKTRPCRARHGQRRARHLQRPAPLRRDGPGRPRRPNAPAAWPRWGRSRSATASRGASRRRTQAAQHAGEGGAARPAVVAGLGNIYVCEALFRTGIIRPTHAPGIAAVAHRGAGAGDPRRAGRRDRGGRIVAARLPAGGRGAWAISSTVSTSTAAKGPRAARRTVERRPADRAVGAVELLLSALPKIRLNRRIR